MRHLDKNYFFEVLLALADFVVLATFVLEVFDGRAVEVVLVLGFADNFVVALADFLARDFMARAVAEFATDFGIFLTEVGCVLALMVRWRRNEK